MVTNKTLKTEKAASYAEGFNASEQVGNLFAFNDGVEKGKRLIINQMLEKKTIIYDASTGYGSALKIQVTKGCQDSVDRVVASMGAAT